MLTPEAKMQTKPLNKLLEKLKVDSNDTTESGISMNMTPSDKQERLSYLVLFSALWRAMDTKIAYKRQSLH